MFEKSIKKKPIYLIIIGIVVISLFIYRIGIVDISRTELILYVAVILLIIFSKSKKKFRVNF